LDLPICSSRTANLIGQLNSLHRAKPNVSDFSELPLAKPQKGSSGSDLSSKQHDLTPELLNGTLSAIKGIFGAEMMGYKQLTIEKSNYIQLKEQILSRWSGLDEETLADTLEGITDLHEMIAAVIRSALVDEALQSGLRARIVDMKSRLSRLEERGSKKRQLALEAMTEVGLKKLEQPDFTASARAGLPGLVVVEEDRIPQSYWVPQPPKLDRQSLLAHLKREGPIPGTELTNPKPTLSVRTK
jgi:hypothetical protein